MYKVLIDWADFKKGNLIELKDVSVIEKAIELKVIELLKPESKK